MKEKLAISRSGHDKGNIYLIIEEADTDVYVADGRLKTIEKPKRKNKKHIQIIKKLPEEINKMFEQDKKIQNDDIKRVIKLYKAKVDKQ